MRALPDFTRTSLPLCRTVFTCPFTTSMLIGPVTAMASPSMTPTESEAGWSGRAAAAAINATQAMAPQATGMAARRQRPTELENTVTPRFSQPRGRKVSPILYVGGSAAA